MKTNTNTFPTQAMCRPGGIQSETYSYHASIQRLMISAFDTTSPRTAQWYFLSGSLAYLLPTQDVVAGDNFPQDRFPPNLAMVPAAVSWVSTVGHSAGNHGREERLAIIGSRGKEGELCAV